MKPVRCLFGAALFLSAAATAWAAAPGTYSIVKQVPLGAPDKWDFVTFDSPTKHVLVSHGTEITVVDGVSGSVVGHVGGMNTSHGVVAVPSLGRGYADSSNSKTVTMFDLKTLAVQGTMTAGDDSDAMVFDPATKRVFVMDADGTAFTAIDAVAGKTLSTIPLKAEPESAVVDGAGHLFVNLASTGELARINTSTFTIEARWPVPDCQSPHGLSMDTKTNRMFISCVNAKMQVVAGDDGHLVASFPIGAGTDADAFDPVRHLAFSSNADGTLSVIHETGPDKFEALPPVKTALGARTMTLDPQTGRLYLVTADVASSTPGEAGRKPHIAFVPGSVKLLILDPAK